MARVVLAVSRLIHRYQFFFFIAVFLVGIQLFLGYNFYSISQDELKAIETWNRNRALNVNLPVNGLDLRLEHPFAPSKKIYRGQSELYSDFVRNDVRTPKNEPLIGEHSNISSKLQLQENGQFHSADNGIYNLRCDITEHNNKEAYSALERASSAVCKRQITDVVCAHREGKLFTQKELPNNCPLRIKKRGQHKGCFRDSKEKRLLADLSKTYPTDNTIDKCVLSCLQAGFEFAGVEWGVECYCGETFHESDATPLTADYCSTPCTGDSSKQCGGYNAISIYTTGAGARKYEYPALVDSDDVPAGTRAARVAFILTLNGRALRQVTRLIKALYHKDHYILIHVDSRQDYLHRELCRLTGNYSNIRMAPKRFATIWGGANLTTMLLECFRFLFKQTDWAWDFIINLSESDFPIRPMEQLVAFLSMNKGLNFLKSHGKDTPRFIQKQGLERIFVQCDNHMWRVGERKLPRGIRIDGGSDWVALNREFCDYLVTSDDELLREVQKYWEYTLLPGESFWHTVLQNSRFCTTFGNNNLHVVNWMRRKGCKCQYKAIVDWCGCSPNDFIDGDLPKLMSLHEKKKVVFFARKFEAIVSQEIINQLDAFLHGSYPPGTPGLMSYWENIYSVHDTPSQLSDTDRTFYQTFAEIMLDDLVHKYGSGKCLLQATQILEVSVLKQVDLFQGLLVKVEVRSNNLNTTYTLEALVRHNPMLQLYGSGEAVARLKNIETGLNFDPKEEFFRSHGNLMGPHSIITVTVYWLTGPAMRVTVAVIDPAQVIATSFDIDVKNHEHAIPLVMDFTLPLRPGIWSVKILHQWTIIGESHFLISPYLFYGGRPIRDQEVPSLHNGPASNYITDKDFTNLKDFLDLDDPKLAASVAMRNADKTDKHLKNWVSDLISKFWAVSEVCTTEPVTFCARLDICRQTTWSSLSPDPKSELGRVNASTGRLR